MRFKRGVKEVLKMSNKFAFAILNNVKENIEKNKPPRYNPIFLTGLNENKRDSIFNDIFDSYTPLPCDEISMDSIKNSNLIIIENIERLVNDKSLQDETRKLIDYCLNQEVQIILCSNIDLEDLKVDERLKNRMSNGLKGYWK